MFVQSYTDKSVDLFFCTRVFHIPDQYFWLAQFTWKVSLQEFTRYSWHVDELFCTDILLKHDFLMLLWSSSEKKNKTQDC